MRICIIPCALKIRDELKYQFGNIPNILIPLENKPFFSYVYHSLRRYVDYFVIVTTHEFINLVNKSFSSLSDKLFVVPCEKHADLLSTVKTGYDFISSRLGDNSGFELIINFGDTFIDCSDYGFDKDFLFYSIVNDNTEWTSFTLANGKICDIIDKKESNICRFSFSVFCGFFFFRNTKLLEEIWKDSNDEYGEFYRVLSEYSANSYIEFIETNKWIDIGHLKEYYQSKKAIASRYFNVIDIDERRGVLIKSSSDKLKLIREILWYLKLPKDIRYVVPGIYDYSLDIEKPFLKMEYLPYPTLHELYIFTELPLYVWKNIISNLIFLLNELSRFKYDVSHNDFHNAVKTMYVDKTFERVEELRQTDSFLHNLYKTSLVINNITYKSAEYYVNNLDQVLELSGIYNSDVLTVIHGDYCASNILCDIQYNILRLIDPRGSFGTYDIYGDSLYDIAKLLHSFDGKYDFIISDRFKLSLVDNVIEYSFDMHKRHMDIDELIIPVLIGEYGENFYRARLIEGILFVSMLPLHKDNPKRQKLMLCRSIELLDDAFKYYGFRGSE